MDDWAGSSIVVVIIGTPQARLVMTKVTPQGGTNGSASKLVLRVNARRTVLLIIPGRTSGRYEDLVVLRGMTESGHPRVQFGTQAGRNDAEIDNGLWLRIVGG